MGSAALTEGVQASLHQGPVGGHLVPQHARNNALQLGCDAGQGGGVADMRALSIKLAALASRRGMVGNQVFDQGRDAGVVEREGGRQLGVQPALQAVAKLHGACKQTGRERVRDTAALSSLHALQMLHGSPSESRPASISGWSGSTSAPSMPVTISLTRASMVAWAAAGSAAAAAATASLRGLARAPSPVAGTSAAAGFLAGANFEKIAGTCGMPRSSLDQRMLAPMTLARWPGLLSADWSRDMPASPAGQPESTEPERGFSDLAAQDQVHSAHAASPVLT